MSQADSHADAVGVRWPELLVALFLMTLAGLVLADSLRVGIGWGEDGPRSGYFPFYIGLALLGSSGWTAFKALRRWRVREVFAEREQLRLVMAILWPMTVYVALVTVMGIYVSSVVLVAYFMLRHGKHGAALTAAVSVGVPLFFYLVFERWFLVPLPKGPLEALVGL
ncbi:MAG: tripartite tricarboxylate transporter TctB family protein [Betaproteobacteria bacterium]|nr:tripartite tricarboxylate transporter TctB family protein [Betaproteobacteria bacterium]